MWILSIAYLMCRNYLGYIRETHVLRRQPMALVFRTFLPMFSWNLPCGFPNMPMSWSSESRSISPYMAKGTLGVLAGTCSLRQLQSSFPHKLSTCYQSPGSMPLIGHLWTRHFIYRILGFLSCKIETAITATLRDVNIKLAHGFAKSLYLLNSPA